jgi:2-oxoacid:acceptor oxidoreductase delta subunit (pyruvate/2-ketoisovalerate family)
MPASSPAATWCPAERNVTVAIGHGKKAARHIDAWLHGETAQTQPKHADRELRDAQPLVLRRRAEDVRPMLDIIRRIHLRRGAGRPRRGNALYEARRCLSCGNCFECDNCYGVCPDNAVLKLGPGKGFEFNYDYCKGCGICVSECPCGAIEMVPESL